MRWLSLAVLCGCVVAAASCSSSDDGDGKKLGGGPGSPCNADGQCTGYDNAACLTELKPLDGLIQPDAGVAGQTFGSFDIPFPGGYCANHIDDSCKADADCGSGACFRPLEGVPASTLASLDALVSVFSVSGFASVGLCMQPCDKDADCRTDEKYKCVVPIHDLLNIVNPDYQKKFCIQDVDTKYLIVGGAPDGG